MKTVIIALTLASAGCATIEAPRTIVEDYSKFAQTFDVNIIPNEGDRNVIALAITDMNTLLAILSSKSPSALENIDVHIARAASSLRSAQQVYLKYRVTLPKTQIAEYDKLSVQLSTLLVELETKRVTNMQTFNQTAHLLLSIVNGLYSK